MLGKVGLSARLILACGLTLAMFAPPIEGAAAKGLGVLYAFEGGSDGAFPSAGVIMDGAGNLYGTTTEKGPVACTTGKKPYGCGTVFKIKE